MSDSRPMVGLSDSKFDSDLHSNEIDHDFFDNPCVSTRALNPKEIGSGDKELLAVEPSIVHEPIRELIPGQNPPLSLSISKPSGIFLQDELETPETCVSSPNPDYSQGHNQMFSTGKLLECLTQSDDLQGLVDFKLNVPQPMRGPSNLSSGFQPFISSGPNSSFFNLDFDKAPMNGESGEDEGFLSQDASTAQPNLESSMKLFDGSISSSSEDSDSESDPESLDTEDEEFVDLLEKYYDYIDLGESDYSDITEVSPMSSLTASPLPPYNGINSVEDNNALASESGDSSSHGLALSLCPSGRLAHHHGHILKPKPLPPLIIHTVEEVSGVHQYGNMYWQHNAQAPNMTGNPGTQESGPNHPQSSLLMKVDPVGLEGQDSGKITGQGAGGLSSADQACSSSTASSGLSFRTLSSAGSRAASSTGSSAGNKRQGKNHSFTPDQIRRIEKDNSALLKKILDTNKGHHGHRWHSKASHHHRAGHHQTLKASATIARQRQQRRIDHENSILIRRIQNVKPSKEIVDAFGTTKCT